MIGQCAGVMTVSWKLWRGINKMCRHQRNICCIRKRVVRRNKTMVYLVNPFESLTARRS